MRKLWLAVGLAIAASACSSADSADSGGGPDAGSRADAVGGDDVSMMGDPDATASDPDATAADPDAMGADPDATSGDPDAMAGDPDATASDPDATASDPDAMTGDPDASSNPDASSGPDAGSMAPPPVTRGGLYFGFSERFNRFYTDPAWTPARTIYVSANGTGSGATAMTPAAASDTPSFATPGTRIVFLAGTYANFCTELTDTESGTYDDPIVLDAERGPNGERLVLIECCGSGRQTCINFENASYVAVRGFELSGGRYGVRSVGAGFNASEHARGIAVIDVDAHDQNRDPLFTGHSDWAVWERNLAHNAGSGDGHGIYLSNGSDWNIVRHNELWNNASSDFQINADPQFTCVDDGVAFDDPLCDAYAGSGGEGGRGASDYMLVENNFFHHGNAQGANFTSVRRSLVRNNIFAFYARHGVSFWQETDNPNLGSSDNQILHNVFVANNNRQMIQFIVNSTRNEVANNLFAGTVSNAVWMETDATVGANTYSGNYYMQGSFGGDAPRTANMTETARPDFDPAWFAAFPAMTNHDPADFRPSATAPFLGFASRNMGALFDQTGTLRNDPTEPGPFESP